MYGVTTKPTLAASAAFADACVADEVGAEFVEHEDDYAYERKVDRTSRWSGLTSQPRPLVVSGQDY